MKLRRIRQVCKEEKISKGSLDLIPSPSKSREYLIFFRQNIARCCQQIFCFQKFVDNAQQCFAFTPQAIFPAHNLNFY